MRFLNQRSALLIVTSILSVSLLAGCGKAKKTQSKNAAPTSAEPDKVLFERAMNDISKNRHTVGRLTLQTLINTYPDSEYLAKAKLAVADSFYKEGGTQGLTQAAAEYEDFATFFPQLEEAAYARFQVGMCFYRRMEKPDRDRSSTKRAEEALQGFLLKFPDSKWTAEAEQRLREVQEVLAEGDYRISLYYYRKKSLRAAAGRLLEMVDRYPLYSQVDSALMMLGDIFERNEKPQIASNYYLRVVKDYPLSDQVADAKKRLEKIGVPIPQPNPEALARMQKERDFEKEKPGMLRRAAGILSSGPDISTASHTGPPTLTPPVEPGGAAISPGGSMNVHASPTGGTAVATVQSGGSEAIVIPQTDPNAAGESSSKERRRAFANSFPGNAGKRFELLILATKPILNCSV
ncbi:MAG: outer membrane protein assembly factor BamD [Acidobacteria bacterium]|nr:outer membrane protein assembly factor BamD [Acidobacteriota bacterium]